MERASPRQAFLQGYLTGLLFFGGTVWWIGYVSIPGAVLLVVYLALFFGAWGWLAHRFLRSRPNSLWLLVLLPAAWTALEYVRSHLLTGLGWNLLAHTQWNWTEIIQIADTTGVWGVSFLVVFVNVALYRSFHPGASWRDRLKGIVLAVSCVAALYGYGSNALAGIGSLQGPSFRVCLAQGNIPQEEKWDESFRKFIWSRYEGLTQQAAKNHPDLIVWPETAVPGFLGEAEVDDRLPTIVQDAGVPLLVGVPTSPAYWADESVYNSAVLFAANTQQLEQYNKIHLVPFGEFIPLRPILGWLKRFYPVADFAPGDRLTVFRMVPTAEPQAESRFSVLICFEDLFPELVRRFKREGAGWFLVITNDAWFKRSAASLQHLQASVFRAVENRAWIARAANTGWTGFVDPGGRRHPNRQIPRFQPGVAMADLPIPTVGSVNGLYLRWGDWLPILCLVMVGLALRLRSGLGRE